MLFQINFIFSQKKTKKFSLKKFSFNLRINDIYCPNYYLNGINNIDKMSRIDCVPTLYINV